MLPTKGYFQDIECPYLNSSCGRPYCHFRHRKKQVDQLEEIVTQAEKETPVVPTYKPTPKSELASIHSSKSHIPISYVPDLAFRPERKARPLPKFEKPTYKPTPLSILSSANRSRISFSDENGEHIKAIKEIKQNIANVEYDPTISLQPATDIDFEDLSTEFDLIDEIINSNDKPKTNIDNDTYDPSKTVVKPVSADKNKKKVPLENQHQEDIPSSSNKNDDCFGEKTKEGSSKDPEKARSKSKGESKSKSSKDQQKSSKSSKNEDKKEGTKKESFKETVHRSVEKSQIINSKDKDCKEKSDSTSSKSEKEAILCDKPKNTDINKSKSNKEKPSEKSKEKIKHKQENKEKEKHSIKRGKGDSEIKEENRDKSKSGEKKIYKEECKDERKQKLDKERSKEKQKHKEKTQKHESSSSDKQNKHIVEKKEKKNHGEKERSKDEHTNRVKEKHRNREKTSKSTSQKTGHKREESRGRHKDKIKKSTEYPTGENDISDDDDHLDNEYMVSNNMEVDIDYEEDEDETMMECYRIFNEYKPPQLMDEESSPEKSEEVVSSSSDIYIPENVGKQFKKRIAHPNSLKSQMYQEIIPQVKPKIISTPGQSLANRYKLAKLAQANREQELLMNEMHQNTIAKRPAPSLLEAARERKKRREIEKEQKSNQSTSLVDDILQGTSRNPQLKIPTKIAPAQNVMLMAKAKERISRIKPAAPLKTIAQTQKSARVAHIPDVSLTDIPDVLEADKSKLPVNVRTRFLTMIADECVKLYISKDEAFTRALNEEYSCYEKCKVLATYRNSAMLAVNRLRKEIQERNKTGLGLIGIGEDTDRDSSSEYKGRKFYDRIKKWVLTEEELDIHGYPRESEEHHGKAVIRNFKRQVASNLDENQRMCCRCHKLYQVDDDGWPLFEEECCYHPMKKRTIRGEQTYLCCRSSDESGCATSDTHVSETAVTGELDGFQTTMPPEYDNDSRNYAIYALDCEMCYTTKGLELTRVTVVDTECKTVYESLVKPFNPIIDYNTRFSGITKEQMDKTSTSILQVQANILHLCNSKTILVGHSLESDMKALKIVHEHVIDTSVLFPHKMGLPHKRALRALASEHLRKIIQNDISGHDSAEDALTCMELLKWKLNNELKGKGS